MTEFKYKEDDLLKEIEHYVHNTYQSHYVGENKTQALDLIFSTGHGLGFCIGNILKYGARYGKKDGHNRKDLLKILHYSLLALYCHDQENPETLEDKPLITNYRKIGRHNA